MSQKIIHLYHLARTHLQTPATRTRTGIRHPLSPRRRCRYVTRSSSDFARPPSSTCVEMKMEEDSIHTATNEQQRTDVLRRSDTDTHSSTGRTNSASQRSRSFLFALNRSTPLRPQVTAQGRDGYKAGILEQLETDFLHSQGIRRSEDGKPATQRRYRSFDRKAVADPYARMIASPIRRCAVTGAKLPKDFMIRLRQVSVSFPSLVSPPSIPNPSSADTSTKSLAHGQLAAIKRTYIVPSGLVTQPSSPTKTTELADDGGGDSRSRERDAGASEDAGNKVGKSKYVICRRETFKSLLSRKKDRKQLGHESEISPLIVEQITEQLQQRVFLEIQKICDTSKQQRKRKDGVLSGIERGMDSRIDASEIRGADGEDILLPLTPEEESNVREQSRMPFRLAERGVHAFLDLRDATTTDNDSEEVRYSDVPILYLQTSFKSGHETSASELASTMASEAESLEAEPIGIPLFKLNKPFLGSLVQQSRELLRGAIYPSGSREQPQLTMMALCSSGNVHDQAGHSAEIASDNVQSDTGAGVEGREKSGDGVSLFIALWRLRLWNGMGWTVPVTTTADKKLKRDDLDSQTGHVDEKTEHEDVARQVREQAKGQVVQGFDVVQGVMHGKWM